MTPAQLSTFRADMGAIKGVDMEVVTPSGGPEQKRGEGRTPRGWACNASGLLGE